jgi:hypothetical protein
MCRAVGSGKRERSEVTGQPVVDHLLGACGEGDLPDEDVHGLTDTGVAHPARDGTHGEPSQPVSPRWRRSGVNDLRAVSPVEVLGERSSTHWPPSGDL